MMIAAAVSSALAAFLFWNAASELPHSALIRMSAGGAAILACALATAVTRGLLRDSASPRMLLSRLPRKSDSLFVGNGREWTTVDAEEALGSSPSSSRVALSPLFLSNATLQQHALILGTTGAGKTRLLELLILQAIGRGEPVAVIDPKGDERLLDIVRRTAGREGRRFRYFSLPVPGESLRYNPIGSYLDPREVADRVAATLPSAGEAQAFRNFAWEIVHTVARALHAAGEPVTFAALQRYALEDPGALGRRGKGPEFAAVASLARRPRDHYLKMASALMPVLARLASCEVLAPGWSWERGASEREVAYFLLGSLLGAETAGAVAKMALLDFQSWVGRRYVERCAAPFWLFVDELADVLTPEFVHVLNKARGAGVRVVSCAQTMADLEAALGSRARALQVIGNVSTVFQFRPQSVEDAEAFGNLAGLRLLRIPTEGTVYEPALFGSGHRGIDDYRAAFSRQLVPSDRPVVPPSALLSLPTFHYFARWGGRIFRGRVPLVTDDDDGKMDPRDGIRDGRGQGGVRRA